MCSMTSADDTTDIAHRLRFAGIDRTTTEALNEVWKLVEPVLPQILERF